MRQDILYLQGKINNKKKPGRRIHLWLHNQHNLSSVFKGAVTKEIQNFRVDNQISEQTKHELKKKDFKCHYIYKECNNTNKTK